MRESNWGRQGLLAARALPLGYVWSRQKKAAWITSFSWTRAEPQIEGGRDAECGVAER